MKRVVVVGSGGQDGRLLVERLSREGHAVLGVERASVSGRDAFDAGMPAALDIADAGAVERALAVARPDEVYYLAAYHHSSEQTAGEMSALLRASEEVHVRGLVNVLEALRKAAPSCRTFYAASSHVFGTPVMALQNETTPLEPRSVYAITKTAGIHFCRLYREQHGMHVSVGVLYNHESPYRGRQFVTQRIVHGAVAAADAKRAGRTASLELGNPDAVVDWGYAPDYVDAMIRMLAHPSGDDYVVATGIPHTIADFANIAFGELGLDWKEHVTVKADLVRRHLPTLVGDSTKLRSATGWRPTLRFDEMVKLLVRAALPP
jgi:GDPmannose 4,6-dehydratase